MNGARIRQAGDAGLLLELDAVIDRAVNARAIGIAHALRDRQIAGVRDVVSTYRSVAVYFDPLTTDVASLEHALADAQQAPAPHLRGRAIEVPVKYGGGEGPDLDAVAARAGLTAADVVARHSGREYHVFMLGFLPGFAYMGTVDERIAAARHASPRLRVPAGAVGIAGQQTGVYPVDSPGGWQIVGRTPLRVFDAARREPTLFAPGDRVRFVPITQAAAAEPLAPAAVRPPTASRTATVLAPGLFTTVQDRGRWGHQAQGVPVSGAMDVAAHDAANAAVGNPRDAASLEVTLQGPQLRFDSDSLVAVTGADLQPLIGDTAIAPGTGVRCRAGDVLRFGERRSGTRAYIAIDGGIDVPAVMGSRSTHVVTHLGGIDGRALRAGDVLALGDPHAAAVRPVQADTGAGAVAQRSSVGATATGGARLRVMAGPQDDWFADSALATLQRSRFTITPQSNRMGYRLAGGRRIDRATDREMISDATFTGGVQVPPGGDPILLLADRQTTGGYPQIATVITADLPLAAQLAPGDWIEFEVCSRADAIAALAAREGPLRARA